MLRELRSRPKCAAIRPRTSIVGESKACTIAYWSSASFLASVLMMARRCVVLLVTTTSRWVLPVWAIGCIEIHYCISYHQRAVRQVPSTTAGNAPVEGDPRDHTGRPAGDRVHRPGHDQHQGRRGGPARSGPGPWLGTGGGVLSPAGLGRAGCRLIWDSVQSAVARCVADGALDIVGVALSTQRESVLAWRRSTGQPIGPVLGWQDQRTAEWCSTIDYADAAALVSARTGLRIDAMFSAPKIRWLLTQLASGIDRDDVAVGTIDAWLTWRLTGGRVHACDAGNASRTLLYDVVDLGLVGGAVRALRGAEDSLAGGPAIRRFVRGGP